MTQASGSFEVNITPQTGDVVEGVSVGRLSLDKQFHGDLEATSKGEMLAANTEVGSALYVAIERVTGTLHGRSGSFVLVHKGTMTSAAQELMISVAPDSGTGELTGLSGTMSIANVEGNHSYSFEYTLAEAV